MKNKQDSEKYKLHEAVKENKNDDVKKLLAANKDPNELDKEFHSPAYYCHLYGNLLGLNILKAYGGKIHENEKEPKLLKSVENFKKIENLKKEVEDLKENKKEIKLLKKQLKKNEKEKEKTKLNFDALNDRLEDFEESLQIIQKQNKKIKFLEKVVLNLILKKDSSKCWTHFKDTDLDLNSTIEKNKTILHLACEEGREDIVKALIDSKRVIIDAKDDSDRTPFHYNCIEGNFKIMNILISGGADINAKTKRKKNGLFFAFCENNKEICEYLIEREEKNFDGIYKSIFNLLEFDKEKDDILMLFLKDYIKKGKDLQIVNGDGFTPIHIAVKNGHLKIVDFFLKEKIFDVNEKSQFGYTPLHIACENGELECVKILIENEANLDAKNNNGDFPIHKAAYRGYTEIINYLALSGSKLDPKNFNFDTPLHLLSFYGHSEALEMMIKKKAKINVKNKNDNTALHLASKHDHLKCIKVLLENNIYFNTKNENGYTALILACYHGHEKICNELIKFCGLEESDQFGWTALHWAAHFGHGGCVRALVGKGANIEAKSKVGDTPYNNAKAHFQEDTAKLLLELGAKEC